MSVLMIVNAAVNPEGKEDLAEYSTKSFEIFKNAGAKPLQKNAIDHVLLGNEKPNLVSITEWPDKHSIIDVFTSEEYKNLIPIRDNAFSKLDVFITAPV